MKIVTWNKLWSRPAHEQKTALERAVSIHPFGRTESYRYKNRMKRARKRPVA